ncbi:MAG: MFS transporter [Planctomycetes bacterium]|nr:MFS transporter [Planctomycetota bacterium]
MQSRRSTTHSDPIRSSLRCSVIDGSSYSVMVGLGETYLPAFVLAIGLGEVVAGLMATVPMLLGSVLQMISPIVVKRSGSRRRWVIICATTQALSFLPLILGAWLGYIPGWAVLVAATLYWGAAMAAAPAWNTWMSHLVPPRLRAGFFARRTRFAQTFVMLGLIAGGYILHQTKLQDGPLLGFAIVFSIACLARLLSSVFLIKQVEPAAEDFIERSA